MKAGADDAGGSVGQNAEWLVLGALLLVVAVTFDRTAQIQFTLPKLIGLRLCAAALALSWAWRASRDGVIAVPGVVGPLTVTLAGWWIIVTLCAVDGHTALYGMHGRYNGLINQLTLVGIFLAVATSIGSRRGVRRLVVMFVASLMPVAGYAIVQNFGLDPLVWPNLRPGSTIGHPVPLAASFALAAPFALAFLISEADLNKRRAWMAVLVILLFATATTLSRGPWIGVMVALAIVLAAGLRAGALHLRNNAIWIVGAAVVFILMWDLSIITRVSTRLKLMSQLDADPSFSNRFVLFGAALQIVRDYPVTGTGLETFGLLYPRYRPVEAETVPPDIIPTMVHNGYLQAASTTGIPGLLLYLALIGSVLILLWRAVGALSSGESRQTRSDERLRDWMLAAAFGAAISGYLIQDLSGWQEIPLSTFFWVITGAAVAFCSTVVLPRRYAWGSSLRSAAVAGGCVAALSQLALSAEAWRELRADRTFFVAHFLDAKREWPAIESRIDAGLRSGRDDPYFEDAAGVLWLKRLRAAPSRDAYDRAAALLDAAAQKNPFDPYIRVHRLDLETAALQSRIASTPAEAAARTVGRLLEMDPNNATVYESVATFRAASGSYGDALGSIRKAQSLRPHHVRYHAVEGDILHATGDHAGAVSPYRREAELLESGSPEWIANEHKLIVTLAQSGANRQAVQESLALIAKAPADALGYTLLGIGYQRIGDGDLARASFDRALALDPNSATAAQGRREAAEMAISEPSATAKRR